MCKMLGRLGLSFKNTLHASEQERADVAVARQSWAAGRAALQAGRLVFLDET